MSLVASAPVLVLPGFGGSGPLHWQLEWERHYPVFRRIEQRDWFNPELGEWTATLDRAVDLAGSEVVLVAHSLACLLVAHWARRAGGRVRGALLVAPPDPEGNAFPPELASFSAVARERLPFRSIVVGSTDDPYAAPAFARGCAASWGGEYVEVGACGHINAASGLGAWPVGLSCLRRLLR